MRLTDEQASQEYQKAIEALIDKYGLATNVPVDEWREVSEILRLRHTINALGGEITPRQLSQYMFSPATIAKVNPSFAESEDKPNTRKGKMQNVYSWLDKNPGQTITTQQFAEIASLSYPTVLKFIDTNPQYFRKIKRGQYEVRNPKEERQEAE